MSFSLPLEVLATLREFRTCELTTIAKRGTPLTWPVSARYFPEKNLFLMTTSIGFPQKAYNLRRNPHISMLFSNPTGSGLQKSAAVLVQGEAKVGDEVMSSVSQAEGLREYWLESIFKRQPSASIVSRNPLMRLWMDWYYLRLLITITPRRIYWWPEGDFSVSPCKIEVPHVE